MDTVRRYENGKINYEPSGEECITNYCPMCGSEVELVEWECNDIENNKFVTIIGAYCNECSSIISERLLDTKI